MAGRTVVLVAGLAATSSIGQPLITQAGGYLVTQAGDRLVTQTSAAASGESVHVPTVTVTGS